MLMVLPTPLRRLVALLVGINSALIPFMSPPNIVKRIFGLLFVVLQLARVEAGAAAIKTNGNGGPTDVGIVEFRKLVMGAARALARGEEPRAAAAAPRYAVRSGGWVTAPERSLGEAMTERFGHPHGYVGGLYGLGD